MAKVLLTHSIGPYELGWGQDMFDVFGARLTRGQGPFNLRGHLHAFALHTIAQNLSVPVTVLEWPTEHLFREELKKQYDFLGIQVFSIHLPKIARMVRIAREVAPATRIVLGGYGVMHLYKGFPGDPPEPARYLRENADHVCMEEGVAFFRKLLGEPLDRPIRQEFQTDSWASLRGAKSLARFRFTSTLVALGCPNACEFCSTSAFFRANKIVVAPPEEVCSSLKSAVQHTRGDPILFNALFDEDFLLDRSYVSRLGELIQKQDLSGKVNLFCFASVKSLSQYTAEELAAMGIGAVWIGVESKFEEAVTTVHNFQKRKGKDVTELVDDLHRHGILVIASNILGLDFHDRRNLLEDIDFLVSLRPDLYQVSPLTPCPGTALFERMEKEGRIAPDYRCSDLHLWSDNLFRHDAFGRDELKEMYERAHKKLYATNGPSLLRMLDVALRGWQTLAHAPDPHLQARADRCFFMASRLGAALLYSLRKLAPTDTVRRQVDEVEERYLRHVGPYSWKQKLVQRIVCRQLRRVPSEDTLEEVNQPRFVVTRYPGDGSAPKIVKRARPIRHFCEQLSLTAVRRLGGLRPRSLFPVRLRDIDDFPVVFRSIEIEGDRLHYVDEGSGEVLLMLHGNPTWSYLYRHLIRRLQSRYRCVALDLLGYGLSDKPSDGDYSMHAHVRRLAAFVERLDLREITLLCQDWGGIIGLSYAACNKERFRRLVPMNTAAFLPGSLREYGEALRSWGFLYLWAYRLPILGRRMAVEWNLFLKAALRFGFHNRDRQLHEKARLGYLYPFQWPGHRTAILKAVRQVPLLPLGPLRDLLRGTERRLRGWPVRTQIIWGMRDPIFGPWFIEKFESLLPNHAPTLRIPTAGHFLLDDEPEIILHRLEAFLAEDQRGPTSETAIHGAAIAA